MKWKNLQNNGNQLKTSETSMNIVKTREKTIKEIEGFQLQIAANSKEKWPVIWKKNEKLWKSFFSRNQWEPYI